MSVTHEQIQKALDLAGYQDSPTTTQVLVECFRDYVDSGSFRNLDIDEVDENIDTTSHQSDCADELVNI